MPAPVEGTLRADLEYGMWAKSARIGVCSGARSLTRQMFAQKGLEGQLCQSGRLPSLPRDSVGKEGRVEGAIFVDVRHFLFFSFVVALG